jgi:Ca2+-binding RTX toxin-like protein
MVAGDEEGEHVIYGTAGNDTITVKGGQSASDTPREDVYAGAGVDRIIVDYRTMMQPVTLRAPSNDSSGGYWLDVFVGPRGSAVQTLAARQFEQLTLMTGSGNDVVRPVGNGDVIQTGAGSDWFLNREAGPDPDAFHVHGQTRFDGGDGVDAAEADWSDLGAGSAVVLDTTDPTGVTIGTGDSERYLRGIEVLSYFRSGAGDDRIVLHGAQGLAPNPSGDSVPYQHLWTGDGNDTVTLRGSSNNSGIGFFQLYLDGGSDDHLILDMSLASERLTFGGGSSALNGVQMLAAQGAERATVLGGTADDRIEGLSGNDVLQGGGGNDVLIVTNGHDQSDGGAGADTLRLDANLAGAPYPAALDGASFSFSAPASDSGYDGTVKIGGFDTHFTSIERFEVVGTSFNDVIVTGAGDDRIESGAGDDRIDGGAGADWLDGGSGADIMTGGTGDDTYVVDDAADTVTEQAGGGNDTVRTSMSNYVLPTNVERLVYTGTGGTVQGSAGDDEITGGDGDDTLSGGNGNDKLYGGGGADTLDGGAGDDRLDGGSGADTLKGGAAADILSGGAGADTFLGKIAHMNGDRITDLSAGDRITVSDASYSGFSYIHAGSSLSFGGTSLDIGSSNVRLVTAVSATGGVDLVAGNHTASLNDFDGNGHSDILWRNDDGTFSSWQVSGNTAGNQIAANSTLVSGVGTDWQIAKTFDFNGDGRSDILWRNVNSGAITVWTGSEQGWTANAYASAGAGTATTIGAVGDVDGDGKDDVVWQKDGGTSVWQSTGSGLRQNTAFDVSTGTGVKLVGAGDFNGDGKADLLFRNAATGEITERFSTDTGFTAPAYSMTVDRSWHIDGIGDFNGDGKDDLIWRHDGDGTFTEWQSAGSGYVQNTYVNGSVSPDWQIAQVGDFNNDGKADLLFRNVADGTFATWQSNGQAFDQNVVVQPGVGTDWHVVAHDMVMG